MNWRQIFVLLAVILAVCVAQPAGRSREMIEHMREVPQWHCLRYRKFDLVKRCRNYRVGLNR